VSQGSCGNPNADLVVTCTLFGGRSIARLTAVQITFGGREIAANAGVQITLTNITDPETPGPYTLMASTTSDPASVTSTPYSTSGPPDTTISSGPSGLTNDSTPRHDVAGPGLVRRNAGQGHEGRRVRAREVKGKTVLVTAGKSHLAKPRR
jgi:hypothetical protein